MPLHSDNKTIVKEKLHLDKNDPKLLLDEITTFDDALTRARLSLTAVRG